MRRFLIGVLIFILGQLSSRAFCGQLDPNQDNRNPYYVREVPDGVNDRVVSARSISDDHEANEDVLSGEEKNRQEKYSDGYSGEYVPGDYEYDPYQPRDDVAYWESIYGKEDVPDFEVPPPIDGDSIFMGLDELTDAWDDQEDEDAILGKRDAGETRSHIGRTSSSVKQRRNFKNSHSSGKLDYHSMMTDVYQPHFYERNSWRGPKTSSTFEGDENEQLYGSRGSARTAFSSNLEQPESAWASSEVRKPETSMSDFEDSQEVETRMKSELEFAGQFPVALESRSIKSIGGADSLLNSKRKIIQAKKDLIHVAAAGSGKAEVSHAVHKTIEAKKDFIDSVISAKASAIQHKKELLHSVSGSDHTHGYSENGRISGHFHSQDALQSVLDSKQKVIHAKKDLIRASAAGNRAELNDAVVKTLDAKKDLVDSLLSAKTGFNERMSLAEINKDILHSITGFDHSKGYSGASEISGSMQSRGKLQSILDSRQKVIQAKKDLIHVSAVGSKAELNDAVVKALDAKKDLIDSLLSTRAGIIHDKKEFRHSSCCSTNTGKNSFSGVYRNEGASLNSNSEISGQIYAPQSGSIHDHHKLQETEFSSGITTIHDKKSSLHSSERGAGNIAIERKIGVASSSSRSKHDKSSYRISNEKIDSDTQISSSHHSSHSGVHSLESSDRINSARSGSSKTEFTSGTTTIHDKKSSLHSSEGRTSDIAIDGEIGATSSSSHSNHDKDSYRISDKKIESGSQISSSHHSSPSRVNSLESSDRISSARSGSSKTEFSSGTTRIHDKKSSLHSSEGRTSDIAIEGEIGVTSSSSRSNHEKGNSLTLSKKIESNSQIYDGIKLGSVTSHGGNVNFSESSEQISSAEAEESKTKLPHTAAVSEITKIHADAEPETATSVSDSSSEEVSEGKSESEATKLQNSSEPAGFTNTKHVPKTEIDRNTEIKSSISSEITLNHNLGLGSVTHSGFKSESTISSGVSTQSNTKTAKIAEEKSLLEYGKGYAPLKAPEIFVTDHKDDLQSIHKECAPGKCGISGKLHVDLNTKSEISFQHQNEPETVVEYKIPKNLDPREDDEEIMEVNTQSPVSKEVVISSKYADEKSKEVLEYGDSSSNLGANEEEEAIEDVIERVPDVDDHLVTNDEGDQRAEAIGNTKHVRFHGDQDDDDDDDDKEVYETSLTEPEDAFVENKERGSSDEEELESVVGKSEHELGTQIDVNEHLEAKQDSIAVEKSSNAIIRSEIPEAQGTSVENEEEENLSIDHDGRFQVSVKFGHSLNSSNYEHEHEGSTHETKFGEDYSSAAHHHHHHQHQESQMKGKISHFRCLDGYSRAHLPEDVEEFEASQAFANAHCRLINMDVNCSGMTAFMKPECQQLNANLWHPEDSGTPITLWTVKTYLSHGQELAVEMQNRAKWLCDKGLVPKLHTPAMLHLINNLATEHIVGINQESESSLFGTKLLQRRLSSHFAVTPNTFIEFLQHHAFRVIGTGLCYTRPKRCPIGQIYRSFDGSCNNQDHPTWGQCNTAFARVLPARYSDGVHHPPKSVTGSELPNPRSLSVHCFPRKSISSAKLTLAISQWGQILSHDFALQTIDQTVEGGIRCCADGKRQLPKNLQHHSCFPIDIPADDKFYSKFDLRCMDFVRSMTISREDCTLGPADQLNTVTSYLDASPLYGSSKETCDQLRAFKGGRMVVTVRRGRELLPTMTNRSRFCDVMSPTEVCYLAGDVRVNQNPQLAIIQTALLREHNRLADKLTVLNPHWDDERVFQGARKIVIAEYQHITYHEWLPLVIGKKYCRRHRLIPARCQDTMSQDYNPRIKASTINSFTTAAFRLFHSMVDGNINLCPANREISHTLRLSNHFFRPQIIERSNNLDDLIRGLVSQPMQEADENFHPEITEYLFRSRNEFGMDLEALDIQRGRDHGLQSYNGYRKTCGLPRARNFDDLKGEISEKSIEVLKKIYLHVDDIDLIVGAAMEKPSLQGGVFGPVARCLIGEQFYRSRVGDRHFYDIANQPHSFTQEQFKEIKKASFARLLCDTGDNLEEIQSRAFRIISSRNPLTCCNALPKIDLSPWRESEY